MPSKRGTGRRQVVDATSTTTNNSRNPRSNSSSSSSSSSGNAPKQTSTSSAITPKLVTDEQLSKIWASSPNLIETLMKRQTDGVSLVNETGLEGETSHFTGILDTMNIFLKCLEGKYDSSVIDRLKQIFSPLRLLLGQTIAES